MNTTLASWIKSRQQLILPAIILIAVLHGLLYVYLVPPWQHYDEPTHFEYAWLIANTGEIPEEDGFDWAFRSDLVRSLIEHDFYAGQKSPDPDNLVTLPPGLQFPQLDDPPLYYLVTSVPIRMMKSADLADQLIAARMVSVALLAVTVFSAWGVVREVTREGSSFRYFVPLTMAMLPGFVDLMTAVNNDVGAIAIFSVFLWGAVRVIQRGTSPLNIIWVILASLVAVFTKSTAFFAVPLAVVALILGILPGELRKYAWLTVGVGSILLSLGMLYFQEPAYWYRATSQTESIREMRADAPLGDFALVLDPHAEITPRWLRAINQPVALDDVTRLRGRQVALGVWMWFESPDPELVEIAARSPALNVDVVLGEDYVVQENVLVTRQPLFFTFNVDISENAVRLWISMTQSFNQSDSTGLKILYDGFVLAEGEYASGTLPEFSFQDGSSGTWDGKAFVNFIRNPSVEKSWLAVRPWADNIAARILPSNIRPTILLYTLFDQDGASWYYRAAGQNIFETFWGRFGWGHVPLPGAPAIYRGFGLLTVLAVIGVVVFPFGTKTKIPVDAFLFLGLSLLLVWFAAFARGAIFIFVEHVFQPSARYALPAIIPTIIVLVAGWYAIAVYFRRWFKIPKFYFIALYIYFLFFLDVISLWGINTYYG